VLLGWLLLNASGGAQLADAAATGLPASTIIAEGALVFEEGTPPSDYANFTLATVNANRTDSMTITGTGNFYPSWTPDGRIIFVSLRSGQAQIWAMNEDGSNAHQIGNLTGVIPRTPEMARNGLIAFSTPTATGSENLMTMKGDGTDVRTVPLPSGMRPSLFSLAPAGDWIVFSNETDSPHHRELWRVNIDGTGLTQLTFPTNPNYPDANAPSISPDGKQIAFFYGKGRDADPAGFTQSIFTWGNRNIAVMPADGGPITILTKCKPVTTEAELRALSRSGGCFAADNPAWTPDGGSLLYDNSRGGTWLIRADGRDAQMLLPFDVQAHDNAHVPLELTFLNVSSKFDLGGATKTLDGGLLLTGGSVQNGTLMSNGTFSLQAGTVNAILAGTGVVIKTTADTVTLSGANTYTGGTYLQAGTLALSGAGALGAASGSTNVSGGRLDLGSTTQVQNGGLILSGGTIQNGTLTSSGTFALQAGTVSAVLSGMGAVSKTTDDTVTLSGANTYTGSTAINAGTLNVIGSIANSSSVTVNSGATLSGTGTVGATQINAGGTFAPGSGVPGTSMTGAGSLAFASGALYVVNLNPTTASFATDTGTASLAGSVQANFVSGSYVAKQYTILTAGGGVTGTFSGITNVNLPAGATDSLSYTANSVLLNLAPGFTGFTGLNTDQRNVANALTTFFNTTGGIPAQFFLLTPAGLTQIDGEVGTGAERAAFQLTTEFLELMLDPFVNGRGNAGGGAFGGPAIGFAPDEQTNLPPDIALAYASMLTKAPPQNFEQRWSAWGSAYGGANRTNGDPSIGSNNMTASTFGFAGGMDYHVSPYTVVGFALAGAGTNWGLANALGTGRSDALQAGAYGISWFGPAYLAGALAFSNHWFSTNRSALGDALTANFVGQSYGARFEGGYRYAVLPAFGITPYGAVQAQAFHTPPYTESDTSSGGFGLSYAATNATDVRTELGARFDDPTLVYGKPLILFGRAAWAHDFLGNPALSARFQALPSGTFTVNGAPIPHDSALSTAGAQLFLTPQWTLLAKFEGEFARSSQTYAGTGTLRYTW
jgi:autotransporter-associated beta strand protein